MLSQKWSLLKCSSGFFFFKLNHFLFAVHIHVWKCFFSQVLGSSRCCSNTSCPRIRCTGVQDRTISKPRSLRTPLGKALLDTAAQSSRSRDPHQLRPATSLFQMFFQPPVWIQQPIYTPAEQPDSQSLHSAESDRLHPVQPTELPSAPAYPAR